MPTDMSINGLLADEGPGPVRVGHWVVLSAELPAGLSPQQRSSAPLDRSDQAAGVVSENLDPAGTTSLILTLLAEGASLELLGRRGVGPEEYADLFAPIWMSVLFGVLPESARF